MAKVVSPILDTRGKPIVREVRTSAPSRPVRASYDAARYSQEFANYWVNSDSLDADSANSKEVRHRLVRRSRYEVANNGYTDGMVQTYATDLIGASPKLKIIDPSISRPMRAFIQKRWHKWCKAVQMRRKLWTMAHAKLQDGEAFAMLSFNPKVKSEVKLEVRLIEAEQCSTPNLAWAADGYIDGIKFDPWGNPVHYDVMHYHPGGNWFPMTGQEYTSVAAKYITHWFLLRRPGQHRAVPEFRSTLNTGAASRRWREATVGAAETAADVSVLLHTTLNPNEIDAADPMSTVEFQKRMMTALPMGYDATQMKAEHPNATYEAFNKAQIAEQGRPKSMPYNKAACDSSGYNYASGRLDHQTYYAMLDFEREDCADLVLDHIFGVWFEEFVLVHGLALDPHEEPDHEWDWPKHPTADSVSEAQADDINLKNGSMPLSQLYASNGYDFETQVEAMANDYGVEVKEMRRILLHAVFNAQNQQASIQQANAVTWRAQANA